MASHGFATLALAFYDFEDLPKNFNIVEVDYFEEAVCYMLQHPKVLLLPSIQPGSLGISAEVVACFRGAKDSLLFVHGRNFFGRLH